MSTSLLDSGLIRLHVGFLSEHPSLYEQLAHGVAWDTRIKARMSASFGPPYN